MSVWRTETSDDLSNTEFEWTNDDDDDDDT